MVHPCTTFQWECHPSPPPPPGHAHVHHHIMLFTDDASLQEIWKKFFDSGNITLYKKGKYTLPENFLSTLAKVDHCDWHLCYAFFKLGDENAAWIFTEVYCLYLDKWTIKGVLHWGGGGVEALNFFFFFGGYVPHRFSKVGSTEQIFSLKN